MCCLWPISLHFVYTAFFESDTHRPDSLWWKPCTTSSLVASRGSRCHRVTLGAEHLGQQSLQDAAAWLVSAGGTGLVPSSSKLPSSPPILTGQREEEAWSTALSASLLCTSSSPCLSPSYEWEFEGPSPGTRESFQTYNQRHNSGKLTEMVFVLLF